MRYKQVHCDVKAAGDGSRTLALTISTGSRDRDGDTIDPEGWQLGNYRRNPVVLWAHDHRTPPIARATSVAVQGGRLVARAQFPTREEAGVGPSEPFLAGTVYHLLRNGYLNAASVGFDPIELVWNERAGGYDFLKQELLEFSIVPVPANAEALVAAGKAGVDTAVVRHWAKAALARTEADAALDELILEGVEAWTAGVADETALDRALGEAVRAEATESVRRSIMALTGRLD